MATKTLDDRRRALEDSFFEKESEKLLTDLRAKSEREIQRRALAEVTKLQDEDLLDHLIDAGIRAETWLAIWLVPLVEVAWADREMAAEEREALLNAAAEHGIEADSDARRLLEVWLARRPGPKLREAWTEYIGIVRGILNDAAREARRRGIGRGGLAAPHRVCAQALLALALQQSGQRVLFLHLPGRREVRSLDRVLAG